MKNKSLLLFTVCCLAAAAYAGPAPVERGKIPERVRPDRKIVIGKSNAMTLTGENTLIVVSPQAGKVTRFAAEELKTFLSQVLKSDIKIVEKPGKGCNIYVGDGEFARSKNIKIADLPRDGFVIKTFNNNILLAGRDDPKSDPVKALKGGVWGQLYERSTLFAVYDFLERFAGCRFYFPGELGTIVPVKSAINVPVCDIYDRPDLLYRRYSTYWDGIYFEGKDRNKKVLPAKTLNGYRLRMETAYFPACHGMGNFRLLDRFADSHPEYFALTDAGKRRTEKTGMFAGHICWSSPVVDVLYEDIKAYLTGKTAASRNITFNRKPGWAPFSFRDLYVDVMPQDGFFLCRCKECQAKADTPEKLNDMIWKQVISWANQLKKDKIPGKITMMAYFPYYMVPDMEIPDNIEVMVADTGAWNNNGTPSARTPVGKGGTSRPAGIAEWHKALKRTVSTWNYMYKNHGNEMPGVPAPSPLAVGRYYSQVTPHLFGVYMASNCDRFLYYAMNYYVFSKLAWNNKTDYKALMREHYQLMYGKAADEMQSLMEEFEHIWIKKVVGRVVETAAGPVNIMPSEQELWSRVLAPAKRAELEKRFDKAIKLTQPGSLERKRIELFRREFMIPMHKEAEKYASRNQAANVMKIVEGRWLTLNGRKISKTEKSPAITRVSVKRQGEMLAVNFRCTEPFMDKVVAVKRKSDDPDTFRDNEVEFLINPSGDRKNYCHFVINSIGCLTDYRCVSMGKRPQADISWNSNAKVKVNRTKQGFDIELLIPMASLKDFKINSAAVNFGRSRKLEKVKDYTPMYVLSPQGAGFHDIENFYRLVEPARELHYDGSFDNLKQIDKKTNRIWRLKKNVAWAQFNTKESYCTLDDKVFYSAPYAMKIVSGNKQGNFVWFTLPKLKPNTRYRLSAVIKLENVVPTNAKGGFSLMLRDNKNHLFPNAQKHQGTSDWFAVSNEFVTDMLVGNAPDCRVLPRIFSASGTVWVDDLSLEEIK